MSNTTAISEKRSEASRINGAKSQGPKTEEGKAISSRNALKHGLYCSVNTLVAAENPEEFAGFHRELYKYFAPSDSYQIVLVEKIIGSLWRRRAMEDILSGMLHPNRSNWETVNGQFGRNQKEIDSAFRILRNLDRTVDAAKRELKTLKSEETKKTEEQTQDLEADCDLVDQLVDERDNDLSKRFPGPPEFTEAIDVEIAIARAIVKHNYWEISEFPDNIVIHKMVEILKDSESVIGIIINRFYAKYPHLENESAPFPILEKIVDDADPDTIRQAKEFLEQHED